MFIEEIDEEKRDTLGDKFEEFGKKLGKLCDMGYDILGDKKMGDKEKKSLSTSWPTLKALKKLPI